MSETETAYDSRPDTLEHIRSVQGFVQRAAENLLDRQRVHDLSKLEDPERSVFDEFTPKLKHSTYGSDEYKSFLAAMKPALDHHYENNSHHPEHYGYLECNGCFKRFPKDYKGQCDQCGYGNFTLRPNVAGMSLLDVLEMLCDWKAATMRHADGDLLKSIEINQKRFGYSDELKSILLNTVRELKLA